MLEKVETAVQATRRVAQTEKAIFGIGFVPSVFYAQLHTLIRRLRQDDNVEVVLRELVTLDQIQALKAGRIDIGFGRIRIDDPDVEQEMLFDEPVMAVLPCSHPLAKTRPTLAELAEYPLIGYPATPGPNFADIALGLFRVAGLGVNVIQQVNDVQTAIGLVASEMGFALVPEQVYRMRRHDVAFVGLWPTSTSPRRCCAAGAGNRPRRSCCGPTRSWASWWRTAAAAVTSWCLSGGLQMQRLDPDAGIRADRGPDKARRGAVSQAPRVRSGQHAAQLERAFQQRAPGGGLRPADRRRARFSRAPARLSERLHQIVDQQPHL